MTDSEGNEGNDIVFQGNSLWRENSKNSGGSEDIDVESGIGTLNEYDIIANLESTEVGGSSKISNESSTRNNKEITEQEFPEQWNEGNRLTNMKHNTPRRHTESNITFNGLSAERNASQRRHTFAETGRNNIKEEDIYPESKLLKISTREKPRKFSVNYGPKASRRHTESNVTFNESSPERNVSQRRYTFVETGRNIIKEEDIHPESKLLKISTKGKPRKFCVNFGPKVSRRHTESNVTFNESSPERNVNQRRYTFAGPWQYDIEEVNYQPENIASKGSKTQNRGQFAVEFEPKRTKTSRRYTEGDILNGPTTRNSDLRRNTYAGLQNTQDYDHHNENSTRKLSKSFSDTEIGVGLQQSNTSFQPRYRNISRRNTIAGDIVVGPIELMGNVNRYSGNSSRFSNTGQRHTIADISSTKELDMPPEEDGVVDPKQETLDEDIISTSEDEQNLSRMCNQYEVVKRHTVAGNGSEYEHGTNPLTGWLTYNNDRASKFNHDYKAREPAVTRRHTIAETSRQNMNDLIDRSELFPTAARAPERRYSDDKSQFQESVNKSKRNSYLQPAPFKRFSVPNHEILDDVIDTNEDIMMDGLSQESSFPRRHTVHTGSQKVELGRRENVPASQTRRRATHCGFTQDNEFNLKDGITNRRSSIRGSVNVVRRNTGIVCSHSDEKDQDPVQNVDDVKMQSGHGYEYHYNSQPEDRVEMNSQESTILERQNKYNEIRPGELDPYYVYSDDETSQHYVARTPRNSSPYIHSKDEVYVHEDDASSRRNNIAGEDNNLMNYEECQPGDHNSLVYVSNKTNPNREKRKSLIQQEKLNSLKMSRAGRRDDEFQHNSGKFIHNGNQIKTTSNELSSNSKSSIASSSRITDRELITDIQTISAKNVLFSGQDERGKKLKFNLSIIQEEDDDEESQKTEKDDILGNSQGDNTKYESNQRECELSKNASIFLENQKHLKQSKKTPVVLPKNEEAINDQAIDKNASDVMRQKDEKKQNEICAGEHDMANKVPKSLRSKKMSTKTHKIKVNRDNAESKSLISCGKEPGDGSHRMTGTLCSPCCSLHRKYQLHHPICCWHMVNNQCDECKTILSLKRIKDYQDINYSSETHDSDKRNDDVTQEISSTSLSSAGGIEQKFSDRTPQRKHINNQIFHNRDFDSQEAKSENGMKAHKLCLKCRGDLEIIAEGQNKSETLEIKPETSERIQVKLQVSRSNLDTSSERGEYKTAEESNVSEDCFNDIKYNSNKDSSHFHRKTTRKRCYRKSYKNKLRRKRSFDQRRVCYVGNNSLSNISTLK